MVYDFQLHKQNGWFYNIYSTLSRRQKIKFLILLVLFINSKLYFFPYIAPSPWANIGGGLKVTAGVRTCDAPSTQARSRRSDHLRATRSLKTFKKLLSANGIEKSKQDPWLRAASPLV